MDCVFPFFLAPSLSGPSSEVCLLPRITLTQAAALPRKENLKSAATGVQVPSKPPPTSPLRLPKDCHRSLGDLKVTINIVYLCNTDSDTKLDYSFLFSLSPCLSDLLSGDSSPGGSLPAAFQT